jgi:hypothetical protein
MRILRVPLITLLFVTGCAGSDGVGPDAGGGDTGVCVPRDEASATACHNGVDDDCDGFIDCGDFSCTRGPEGNLCCDGDGAPERDDERCANGIDDDCNGYTDCQDFACGARSGVTICCGEDGQSVPEADDAACSNGWDDDCDGYADCRDFSCAANNGPQVCCGDGGPEDTAERCGNGLDDDCNGFTDCRDFACSQGAAAAICCTPTPEADAAACDNGRDDDCDGRTDCDDNDCVAEPGRTFCLPGCVPAGAENTNATCANGLDDDCDGYIDCIDFSCSQSAMVTACGNGSVANCQPCERAADCAGGACFRYNSLEDAALYCTSPCTSDADCTAGLSRCVNGHCSHQDAEITAVCAQNGTGRLWTDACGITQGFQPCAAGHTCVPASAGEDDAQCAPPCRALGAVVDRTEGETCCPGLVASYDSLAAGYTERCLVDDGEACSADLQCAGGRSCLGGSCAYCQQARSCSTDADCCDGYGCNGGRCAQLCGASCRGSNYVAGIFCYSSCETRFRCVYECN